jgi:hypothetical protein
VSKILYVMYDSGDASRMGFGSSIKTATGLLYRIGVWVGDEGDETSNYPAIYKGSSKSEKLHGLVVRFLCLQSKFGVLVTVSHVSGKRMIAQGADGLSGGF